MKALLYILGGLLIAPGTALAIFIFLVDGATRQKGLLALIWYVFNRGGELLQAVFLVFLPGLAIWLALAFLPHYRVVGAWGMTAIAVISIVMMFAMCPSKSAGDLFIPIVSLAGLAANAWLIWKN